MKDTVTCPWCKREVKVIPFGYGHVAYCKKCNEFIEIVKEKVKK